MSPPTSDSALVALRNSYYAAAENSRDGDAFAKAVATFDERSDAVRLGYKGMSWMLQARDAYNPYNKIAYFNKGKALLDNAVKQAPDNVEVRFLRFCVQTNAPFFLAYNGNIQDDKRVILNSWATLRDDDLKRRIKDYLKTSDACTDAEKKTLL